MLISFRHGQDIPVTTGQDGFGCGAFGYLFPNSPEAPFGETTLAALAEVHRDMVEQDAPPEGDHSSLPPLFTYFGQFVDHDITGVAPAVGSDPLPPIQDEALAPVARPSVLSKLQNIRTGQFDLDSLYGSEKPTGNDALDKLNSLLRFPGDRAMMWVGTPQSDDGRPPFPTDPGADLLRLDRLLTSGAFIEADIDALRVSGQLIDSFPALLRAALLMENPDH